MIDIEQKINLIRGYVDVLEDTTGWENIYEQAPGLEAMMVLINKLLEDTADYLENFEHIATVQTPDPYDERPGPYYSQEELKKLNDLKSGDMVFVVRRK